MSLGPPPTCPVCRAIIDQDLLPGELVCPACGVYLQPSRGYFRALFIISLCLSFLCLKVAGIHNQYVFLGTIIGAWPVFLVVAAINAMLFPVELEVSDNVHSVVSPTAPPGEALAEADEGPPFVEAEQAGSRARVFTPPRPHRSLEGVALRIGAWVLAISTVYMLLEPTLVRIVPWLPRTAPPAEVFPIRLDRARNGFNIENISKTAWTCTIRVGLLSERSATLRIRSTNHAHLAFESFPPAKAAHDLRTVDVLADQAVFADCVDASGQTVTRLF